MKNVFTYGSLMFSPVWQQIVSQRYVAQEATLPGFVRKRVQGAEYPAIVRNVAHSVSGVVYRAVSGVDIVQLDSFEGEIYRRQVVQLETQDGPLEAHAYVLRRQFRHLLGLRDWSPEAFAANDMQAFIRRTLGRR